MTKHILTKFTIVAALALTLVTSVSAARIQGVSSTYTPERPGIDLNLIDLNGREIGTVAPLSYASFNSANNNPIPQLELVNGEERTFMTVKRCPNADCTNIRPANFQDNVAAGDKLRFTIYFHNNAADPFADITDDAEIARRLASDPRVARNVKIGLDISEESPTGFINASNNSYRAPIFTVAGEKTYTANDYIAPFENAQVGSPVRTVSDDASVNVPEGLSLQIDPNSTFLTMKRTRDGSDLHQVNLPQNSNGAFDVEVNDSGDTISLRVEPDMEEDAIWLNISHIPGCFEYDGFVEFDVLVVEDDQPSVCTDFGFRTEGLPSITADGKYRTNLRVDSLAFSQEIPPEAKIGWLLPDQNAVFRDTNGNNLPKTISDFGFTSVETPAVLGSIFSYTGAGNAINAAVTPAPNGVCTDRVLFPAACKTLEASDTGEVVDGKKVLRLDNLEFLPNMPANTKIEWTSLDPDGRFFNAQNISLGSTTQLNPNQRTIRYEGEGPVLVKAVYDGRSDFRCVDRLTFTPEEPALCQQLFVDHHEPIYQNTVSTFRSRSIDTNDELIGSKIRYSVDSRDGVPVGVFSTNYFLGHTSANDVGADFVLENAANVPNDILRALFTEDDDFSAEAVFGLAGNLLGGQQIFNQIQEPQLFEAPNIIEEQQARFDERRLPAIERFQNNVFGALNGINLENANLNADVLARGSQLVEVDPEETVYFYGLQTGQNVIHVQQLDAQRKVVAEANCKRDFSIVPLPEGPCEDLELTVREFNGNAAVQTLNPETTYTVDGEVDFQNEDPNRPHIIRYNVSPLVGTFLNTNNPELNAFARNVQNLAFGAVVNVHVERLKTADRPVNLQTLGELEDSLNIPGEMFTHFVIGDEEVDNLLITFSQSQPVNINNALFVDAQLNGGNAACSANLPMNFTPEARVCTNLNLDGQFDTTGVESQFSFTVDYLPPNETVSVTSTQCKITKTLNGAYVNELSFGANELDANNRATFFVKCDQNYDPSFIQVLRVQGGPNCFDELAIPPVFDDDEPICRDLQITGGINVDSNQPSRLNISVDEMSFTDTMTVTVDNADCRVNLPGQNANTQRLTFTKEQVGDDNSVSVDVTCNSANIVENERVEVTAIINQNCQDLVSDSRNPEPEGLCVDLDIISPNSPWEPDGNEQVRIDVETRPNSLANELTYKWEVTRGNGEWSENGRDLLTARGDFTQILEDADEDTVIRVSALDDSGDEIANCRDTITAEDRERPRPPREDRETPPEIEKFVRSDNDSERERLTIAEDEDVTYTIKFTPGSKTQVANIKDNDLRGGRIASQEARLDGYLSINNLQISIAENNNRRNKVIYSANGNRVNNNYEEDFSCSEGDNFLDGLSANGEICIADYENVLRDFQNGEEIVFYNLDRLDDDQYILIEYEMTNNSVINEEECKELSKTDGCGETFRNNAQYVSYEYRDSVNEIRDLIEDDDEDVKDVELDREDSGSDSTVVTITCPYQITRQSGDSIFEGGNIPGLIDISKCTPVKSTTGVIIRPERPTPDVPSTGEDDGEVPVLTKPSHDICRSGAVQGFSNALKNFSSTVCELNGEVAAEWQSTNINRQIVANLTRISRWGDNLANRNLKTISDLPDSSGVYVISGQDLTISGQNGAYTISGNAEIPAAQIYIVKNADLVINSNIKYARGIDILNPKNTPSAAFIVIDGDIKIDPKVTEINAILMAVDLDDSDDGRLLSGSGGALSLVPLRVNGSLSGNVNDLFVSRRPTGLDALRNEGAVSIFYDQRILLNPPPGLTDLLDLQQAVVPR